jgi:O-antigen/teichoic acid export membrane protein
MSLKKQALSGVFWTSLQLLGTQGLSLGVSLILARLLLPAEFGLIAMLGIFIGIGSTLIGGGLTQSLIRSENLDEEDYATVFYFNLVGSVVIYVITFLAAPYIAAFYKQELLTNVVRLYTITFIINAFSAIQITRLTKNLDFKTQTKVAVPSLIIGSTVGIVMAYKGFGVWSLVWSGIVQAIASTIQLWIWAKWFPQWVFNIQKFKYHFNYGVKLMFSGVLDALFTNAYIIIIGKFFAPAQVGFYSRADTLSILPVGIVNAVITKVTFPLFSSIQNDDERLKMVYKKIMQMVIFLVAPLLVLMAALAEPLFRFLFTEKWMPAVPYFQILCFTGIMYPIHGYNLQILIVKGRSDLFLKLEILKKVMIALVIVISFQYGVYGLLYGGLLLSVVGFFVNTHFSAKYLSYSSWQQTKDLLPMIVLSIAVGGLVYFMDYFLKINSITDFFRLGIGGSTGVLLYFTITYLFKISALSELIAIIKRK